MTSMYGDYRGLEARAPILPAYVGVGVILGRF